MVENIICLTHVDGLQSCKVTNGDVVISQAIFDAATFANLNGLEYADVRDELIVVCEGLFNATGLQGEIMCPGILDNYAPHVSNSEFFAKD